MNNLGMIQQMFQQVMKSPNPMGTIRNLLGNNNQAMAMLSQIEKMTPEQRQNELNNKCKELGIDPNQLKQFLGLK